jgi:hypothetical protein
VKILISRRVRCVLVTDFMSTMSTSNAEKRRKPAQKMVDITFSRVHQRLLKIRAPQVAGLLERCRAAGLTLATAGDALHVEFERAAPGAD